LPAAAIAVRNCDTLQGSAMKCNGTVSLFCWRQP
jgi:hypothetical protein